ncbi:MULTISPECIES: DUF6783 domain-containing protein [Blautia]|uniref:DUF6783 domain-containing protein n=1 Tax=Blautia TaxID=572511 RepID=UPI002FE6F7B3
MDSVNAARCASLIGSKFPVKCDAQPAESIFQTRSRQNRKFILPQAFPVSCHTCSIFRFQI